MGMRVEISAFRLLSLLCHILQAVWRAPSRGIGAGCG